MGQRAESVDGFAAWGLQFVEEHAQLALFLIENRYMNAASVRLDGGIRMAPR